MSITADPVMHRIIKHINATAGQHLRAIRKGFADAGAPVTATVEPEAQRRIPMVGDLSEGHASAERINRFAAAPDCLNCGAERSACMGLCIGGTR